jgi:hypothetical protein
MTKEDAGRARCVRCGEVRDISPLEDSGDLTKSRNGHGPDINLQSLHKAHGAVNMSWGALCRLLDDIAEATA